MKAILTKIYRNQNSDAAALILRIFLAAVFVPAGFMKFTHPEFLGFFHQMGFSSFDYYLAACSELFGGLLVLFGLLQKPALTALGVVATVIIWGTPAGQDMNTFFGHDFVFTVLVMIFGLYFIGPGKYSIAAWRERRRAR